MTSFYILLMSLLSLLQYCTVLCVRAYCPPTTTRILSTVVSFIRLSKWRYMRCCVEWLPHAAYTAHTVHSCLFCCYLEIGYFSSWNIQVLTFVVFRNIPVSIVVIAECSNRISVKEIGRRKHVHRLLLLEHL